MDAPPWWRERGLKIHWVWVPAAAFFLIAGWYEGGWKRVGLGLLIAIALVAFATRKSKRN